jgi:hypothetical protein
MEAITNAVAAGGLGLATHYYVLARRNKTSHPIILEHEQHMLFQLVFGKRSHNTKAESVV